jgi:spore coat protein CotH
MGVTVQKTKYEGIYKQKEGVLLNMDNEALKAYKARKERERKSISTEKRVEAIESDIREIKELLMKALTK